MKHNSQSTLGRHQRRQGGMAFLSIMLILLFLLTIGLIGTMGRSGGLSSDVENGITATRRRVRTSEAVTLAENGIYSTIQWLSQQPAPPGNTSAFAPSDFFGATTENGYSVVTFPMGPTKTGTFRVRLYPYTTNAASEQKFYVVESVGNYQGQEQIIRAVAFQDTFAKYAYFVDNAPDPDTWWVGGSTKFSGPVHINATTSTGALGRPNILWRNSGSQSNNRIFTYSAGTAFTTSATSVNWTRNSLGNTIAPSTSADWNHIAANGQSSVQMGVTPIQLPSESTLQADGARGQVPKAVMDANPPGVYLPSGGGIYIRGDVDNMILGAEGSSGSGLNAGGTGNVVQRVEVYQTDRSVTPNRQVRYIIKTDPRNSTTTMWRAYADLGSTSFGTNTPISQISGTTNKVIYCDGNIGKQGSSDDDDDDDDDDDNDSEATGGLSQHNNGSAIANALTDANRNIVSPNNWTVATAPDKTLNICGDIRLQGDSMMNNLPTKASGTLGIVSGHVQIVDRRANHIGNPTTTAIDSCTIHATVVAYDTFDVTNAGTRGFTGFALSGRTVTILGGYIAKENGQFGTVWFDGKLRSGFTRTLNYDARVAFAPPPFFPTTANRYQIGSIQRVTSTLE